MKSGLGPCLQRLNYCIVSRVTSHRETRGTPGTVLSVFHSGLLLSSKCFHSNSRIMSIRLFEEKDHAKLYSKYRPTYSDSVYSTIIDYCKSGDSNFRFDLAVDIGCGSGQSTFPLGKYFKHVIGTDVSEQQIASTASVTNDDGHVTFRVGAGEDLSFLSDGTVDLLTSAQALHWLSRDLFYPEVTRVLRPGGVFVAYGYGNNVLANPEADKLQKEFYYELLGGPLGAYWNSRRQHIETHFRDIEHPFPNSQRLEIEALAIRRTMPLDAYVGYISTWSGWRKYLAKHPDADDLEMLSQRLQEVYGDGTTEHGKPEVTVHWPVFMMISRKPS